MKTRQENVCTTLKEKAIRGYAVPVLFLLYYLYIRHDLRLPCGQNAVLKTYTTRCLSL